MNMLHGWIQFSTNLMVAARSVARIGLVAALAFGVTGWRFELAMWWFASGFSLGVGSIALGVYWMFRAGGVRENRRL